MKIRIRRDTFLSLFNQRAAFTATRDIRPIMKNVKMTVSDTGIILMATDGEVGGRGFLPMDDSIIVESTGEAILPATLLKQILSQATDEEITLEYAQSKLTVRGRHSRYQLDTIDSSEPFPNVASFDASTFVKIHGKSLAEMIRRTVFATDQLNSHYDLRGVKFIFKGDRTEAVATDARRLAYQVCASEYIGENSEDDEFQLETLFPTRALNLIGRIAANVDEVLIDARGTDAVVKAGNIVVSTTLLVGRYPDWNSIIPDPESKARVDFIARELAQAVQQAGIVATESKPGVWFNFTKGNVEIAAAGEATGESSVVLPIAYDGEELKIRLDERFLKEFFRCVAAEETIAFYFGGDYRTLIETSDGYRYVVMQMA